MGCLDGVILIPDDQVGVRLQQMRQTSSVTAYQALCRVIRPHVVQIVSDIHHAQRA